ncbi:hypothetical protein P4B09_05545 [Lactiplantibacillus plantarum]
MTKRIEIKPATAADQAALAEIYLVTVSKIFHGSLIHNCKILTKTAVVNSCWSRGLMVSGLAFVRCTGWPTSFICFLWPQISAT